MPALLDTRKDQLSARLSELRLRLSLIEQELESHESRDWSDLATEREGDEVLESMGTAGLREIRVIEAALQRLETGEYGTCMRCGDPIAEARLDLLPYTPFCRSCAA